MIDIKTFFKSRLKCFFSTATYAAIYTIYSHCVQVESKVFFSYMQGCLATINNKKCKKYPEKFMT